MNATRELAFPASILFAVASGLTAGASALASRGSLTLAVTTVAAAGTVGYLGWALLLRAERGLAIAERALALPFALVVGAWALAAESPAACAALTLPALVAGALARPASSAGQATACLAIAVGVALAAGPDARWGIPLFTVTSGGIAGVLLSVARANARSRSPLGRALFSALPMGVLVVDDGRVVRANRAMGELAHRPPEQLTGLPLLHLIAPDDRDRMQALLDSGAEETVDLKARRVDGGLFDASVTVARLESLALVLVADRSDRARAERAKDEFLSTVSHELRTPLASIRGALGLIEGGAAGDVSDKARELVVLGTRNADRMMRLVNDILDLKRIESGRMRLKPQAVDPLQTVRIALDGLAVIAEDAQVSLRTTGESSHAIWGDPDRIVQVLTNLVSNAIKFSPEGSAVTVEISERVGAVRFTVSDQGPGIPDDEQSRLFSRFQQLDQSDSRAVSGSGLGLAIAKAIVHAHDGDIGLEGATRGATFYFEIPQARSASDSSELTPPVT